MKWLSALASIVTFLSWLFDNFKKWQFEKEARAEVAKSINEEQKAIKDETDKIIDTPPSDADFDKRLQDGEF